MDSNPSRSACCATCAVRRQASSGSQPSYSPRQPCGTSGPIFISPASFVEFMVAESWRTCCSGSAALRVQQEVRGHLTQPLDLHLALLERPALAEQLSRGTRDIDPS